MKKILQAMLAIPIVLSLQIPVYAKIDGILVKDSSVNKFYEYNYNELRYSYYDYLTGGQGPLFHEYEKNLYNIVAYSDSNKGYIDYKSIRNGAFDKITKGEAFDLQYFIDTTTDNGIGVSSEIEVRSMENGNIVTKEIKDPTAFDVLRIY